MARALLVAAAAAACLAGFADAAKRRHAGAQRVETTLLEEWGSSRLRGAAGVGVGSGDDSLVVTPSGPIRGTVLSDSVRVFQGVPYANPPVGPSRWTHSQLKTPWAPAVWDGTAEAPGCLQICWNDEPPHICPSVQSEDCLYANIWAPLPSAMTSGPVPVTVFIHGGNFDDGYTGGTNMSGGLLYDGRSYVENTGGIMVVLNYRLGQAGFLYLGTPSLEGNFGLQDQITALNWVRANIAAFGGDPTRITLQGQSAGAMAISAHMSRPQNAGLFNNAIMMSNPFGEPWRNPGDALALAGVFANFSGCSYGGSWPAVESCLRSLPGSVLLNAQFESMVDLIADLDHILQVVVTWSPTVGTPYLPQRPMEAWQAGNVLDVPYLVGTTANETVIFVYEALDTPMSLALYEILAAVLVGEKAFAAAQPLYPLPSPPLDDYRVFASRLLTDGLFWCATRNATEALYASQPGRKSAAYMYLYSHNMSWGTQMWGSNFTECDTQVCHGSDLPGWWHPEQSPAPGYGNYTAAEDAMSALFQSYFYQFAATSSPGSGIPGRTTGPAWPAYTAATRQNFVIGASGDPAGAFVPVSDWRGEFCDFWDAQVGYNVY